jgi:large subunit ribosomal protein L15
MYSDGEIVNLETLREKGFASRSLPGGLTILSNGEITKKITMEAHRFSKGAKEKLEKNNISYKLV